MPRRPAVVLILAVLALISAVGLATSIGAPHRALAAPGVTTTEVNVICPANTAQHGTVDPLLHYGDTMTAHDHLPAGAQAFSSTSTVADMQAAGTSCNLGSDHSMFWVPTPMTAAGVPATVTSMNYYLANQGYDLSAGTSLVGLRFIAGNSACSSTACAIAQFQCNGSIATKHTIPADCGGAGYEETIYSIRQCWDGQSLGMGMGDQTLPANIQDGSAGSCPAGFQAIPGIVATVHVGADGVGGYLSSDVPAGDVGSCNGCSAHLDFVYGQGANPAGEQSLALIDTDCLDATGFSGAQFTCRLKPGTTDLYRIDPATGRVTTFVTR